MNDSSTVTNYQIYLVNQGTTAKTFWCFLEQPEGIQSPEVFANSSAALSVTPNYGGTNSFTIPLQYQIGAGACNQAVGLDVKVITNIAQDTALQSVWNAEYATVPPNQGPQLSRVQAQQSPADTIRVLSNTFDRRKNENNQWYSNMTFGILSSNGFMGVTWSPSPNETSTITPKFGFYISTGSYRSENLADIASISRDAVKVELNDFSQLEATVTLTSTGELIVTPGKP